MKHSFLNGVFVDHSTGMIQWKLGCHVIELATAEKSRGPQLRITISGRGAGELTCVLDAPHLAPKVV